MSAVNDLVMPKLGLTMTEGLLAEWQVKPGDTVRAGQILFVVETDKLSTEIEAAGDGEIVELVANVGATLPVGAVVARWTGEGALGVDTAKAELPVLEAEPVASAPLPSGNRGDRVVASPLAKRIARREGVDLRSLAGTGSNGRIKGRDVEAVLAASIRAAEPQPAAIEPVPTASATAHAFHLVSEADIGPLEDLRARLNADIAPRDIGIDHFLRTAVAHAAQGMADIAIIDARVDNVTYFAPAIAAGQSAALGIGAIRKLFRPDADGQPQLRTELGLILVCDARSVDRTDAAKLLNAIVGLLEKPLGLLAL